MMKECWINVYDRKIYRSILRQGEHYFNKYICMEEAEKFKRFGVNLIYRIHVKMK